MKPGEFGTIQQGLTIESKRLFQIRKLHRQEADFLEIVVTAETIAVNVLLHQKCGYQICDPEVLQFVFGRHLLSSDLCSVVILTRCPRDAHPGPDQTDARYRRRRREAPTWRTWRSHCFLRHD